MLPSIGYFKGINCPFFDSGLCERPYCHFRHAKKDSSNPTSSVSVISEEQDPDGLLQKILSESLNKDLQTSDINQSALSIDSRQNVQPSSTATSSSVVGEQIPLLEVEKKKALPKSYAPTTTVTYKPTPIAELKKRHIPIPYSPTLVKSTTVVAKRCSSDVNGAKRMKTDNPVTSDAHWGDPYSPKAFQMSSRKSNSQSFEYDPDVSDIQKGVGYSTNTSTSITTSPPSNWHNPCVSYKPTPLNYNPYDNHSSPQYEPTECLGEPSYDPVLNMNIGNATYKPSSISNIEPEYRPLGLQKNTKEYHPTDKSKLNTAATTTCSSESLTFDNVVEHDVVRDKKEQLKNNSPDIEKPSTKEDDATRSSKTDKNSRHSHKHRTHSSHKSTNKSKDEKGKNTEAKYKERNTKSHENVSRHSDRKEHSGEQKRHKDTHKKDISKSSNGLKKNENHSHKSKTASDHEMRRSSESSSDKCKTKSDSRKHKDKKSNGHRKSTGDHKSERSGHKSDSKKSSDRSERKHKHHSGKDSRKSSTTKSDKVSDEIGISKSGSDTNTKMNEKAKFDKKLKESHETVIDTDKNGKSPSSESDNIESSSEDDITKECMKIFQEYEPRKVTCLPDPCTKKDEVEHQTLAATTKKRIAHEGAQNVPKPTVAPPPKHIVPNPAQVMAERYQKILAAQQSDSVSLPQQSSTSMNPPAKVRIAQVQNVQMLLSAKKRLDEMKKKTEQKRAQVTTYQTVAQSQKHGRVAHVPSQEIVVRPRVSSEIGGKVPGHIRQNYFNLLSSEFINFCSSEHEAYQKGLEEEQNIYERSASRQLYINLMLLRIHQIRKEGKDSMSTDTKKTPRAITKSSGNRVVSHTAVLAGKGKGSWSIEKPKKILESPKNTYQDFLKYILNEEELKRNGYPRPHAKLTSIAVVYSSYKQTALSNNPLQRICDRCGKEYQVNKDGIALKDEECVNHWGRLYNMRISGSWQERYSCCNEGTMAIGCNHSDCHVSSNFDPNNLRGYVKTIPKEEDPPDGDYGVYALDCEMCYTTVGLELTRVTVIDRTLKSVYETLVKPKNPVIDYNTRFSGINAEILNPVTTSIYDVQSALLSFISAQTILIGHSLESDFKALKIIHDTVVDTSVVFPHRRGPPYKRALKTLSSEYLKKTIQNNESGHDSAEDAKACMELMFWRIKQDGN